MKKTLIVAAAAFCTLPAMAAPAHPLLGMAHASSASSSPVSSVPDLPLPPLQAESSFTFPGFGKGATPTVTVITLPGLGTLTNSGSNPGMGNGQATYSQQLNIDPASTKTPTSVAADFSVPQKGQLAANYTLMGAGFGTASNPTLKPISLPLGGTLTPTYDNQGKGKSLDASLDYLSPAPKTATAK